MLRKIQLWLRRAGFKATCQRVVDLDCPVHVVTQEAHCLNGDNWFVNTDILEMSYLDDLREWMRENHYDLMFHVSLMPHRANGRLGWKLTVSRRTDDTNAEYVERFSTASGGKSPRNPAPTPDPKVNRTFSQWFSDNFSN